MNWNEFIQIVEDRLNTWWALISGLIVFSLFFAAIHPTLKEFISIWFCLCVYLLALFGWVVYWAYNRFRLPRNKKNKVGIVIAIYSENKTEREKLKADFVSELKNSFRKEGVLDVTSIVFLKNHFAHRIHDSDDSRREIEKMNKKVRAHFYVWGNVRKRPDGESAERYFINFHGYVVHKPVAQQLRQQISMEFSKVLPVQVDFLENTSFRGFQVSAAMVHLAAQYIIGVAAFVSHDPNLAYKLHRGLKEKFNSVPHLKDIGNRLPLLVADEAFWIARWYFDNQNYDKTREFLSIAMTESPNHYGAWLFKAIIDFSLDRDSNEALKSVNKAREYANNTFEWRYSEAFLQFWEENYQIALEICQKIKNQSFRDEAFSLAEVRQFNLKILEKEDKAQLYFWIGYLAFFKEKNLGNALHDFEQFEKLADDNMSMLKNKSSVYLKDIKRALELKD